MVAERGPVVVNEVCEECAFGGRATAEEEDGDEHGDDEDDREGKAKEAEEIDACEEVEETVSKDKDGDKRAGGIEHEIDHNDEQVPSG